MQNLLRLSILLSGLLVLSACNGGGGGKNPAPKDIDPGYPEDSFPALNTSNKSFESVHFSGSKTCEACHDDPSTGENRVMVDSMGRDLSLGKAWQSSMMANATRDPYWMAVVATEMHLYPHLVDTMNDVCTRCHAPMANERGRRIGEPLQIFDKTNEAGETVPGLLSLDDTSVAFNHAMDGVSCTLCHQMADDGNLGTPAGMTGGFFVEQYTEENIADRPAYGQYADPDVGYMKSLSNYTPLYGAHTGSSEMCATCHNLTTQAVDTDGNPVEPTAHFPEQMAYTEWENSIFADDGSTPRSCQDCHMPKVEGAVPIAVAGAGDTVRENFAEHTLLGSNTVMLKLLDQYRTELGIDDDIDFEEAIVRNRQFLASSAEVAVKSWERTDEELSLVVEVQNKTGHKLPTGYHSRRAFLHVLVTDASGQTLYENGKVDDDGKIAGVVEDNDPEFYEPHYNVITEPTQVQVYQAIMGNSDGHLTHSLLNGKNYLKDNRLTPAGFDKTQAPDEVSVAGNAANDPNFDMGVDVVNYRIPLSTGSVNVLVELLYQPISFGHARHLFSFSSKVPQVNEFRSMFQNVELKTETIAATELVIE